MQGFKPRGFVVHQQREQKFADGGLVQRLKSLIGGDRKRQIDSAVDAAENPAPKPAPQQEQKVAVSSRDGKFDEKRVNANNPAGIGFADGGRVRPRGFVVGPGTETSDSIPARLSAGEYVLPADTVKAVGVDQLDALREATHKPVKGEGAKAARGFFAGGTPGGLDEAYKSWQDKKTPWYMPTPAGNMEERTAEAAYTQALRNAYSGNSSPSATGQPGGPSRQAAPAPDVPPAQSAPQQSAFDANTAKDNTYGLAPLGNKNPPPANPPPADTPSTTGQQVMPGVYRHGRGQYSDNAQGMGFAPGFTGKPSAQNMAAADALDARSQADSMARLQARGFSPGGGAQAQATYDPNAGASSQWMTDMRDPRTLAMRNASVGSTIFRTEEEAMAANKAKMANVAGVRGAIAAQMHDAQQADTTRYQSDNTLAGTQEQANAQRYVTDAQAAASRQRGAIEAGKLWLEKEVRGFDIRAAQRRESAYDNYSKAKTDEDRQAIAKQFPDLFGQAKDAAHRMEVVRGKTDPMTGQSSGDYVVVQDPKTGEVRQIQMGAGAAPEPQAMPKPASKAEFDALPKGTRFTDPNGQVRIK